MKRIIILFAILLQLVSCVTEKKVAEKVKLYPEKYCLYCPENIVHKTDTIIKIDTVKLTEVDTTFIGSFIDLAVFQAQLKCDSLNRVQMDSLRIASKKGSGFIYIKDNKLIGQFKSKHDSILIINKKLTETITINKNIIDSLKISLNNVQVKYQNQWWIYLIIGALCCLCLFLAFGRRR